MDDKNKTASNETETASNTIDVMEIIQLSIAPVGIVANLTVIVVFLNNKKLRRKIPNKLIVNQVIILYFLEMLNTPLSLYFLFIKLNYRFRSFKCAIEDMLIFNVMGHFNIRLFSFPI